MPLSACFVIRLFCYPAVLLSGCFAIRLFKYRRKSVCGNEKNRDSRLNLSCRNSLFSFYSIQFLILTYAHC